MPHLHRLKSAAALIAIGVILARPAAPQEVLYNGIRLAKPWPPRAASLSHEPASPPPYLVQPPEVIPIDTGRQLFVDDFLIEQTTLQRSFHSAEYLPQNPVLKPDQLWERQETGRNAELWGPGVAAAPYSDGVWWDPKDRLFKMWYRIGYTLATAYAISKDGVHWEKPSLDVVPGTSIVQKEGRGSSTVWLDLEEQDPNRRFKMMSSRSHMQPQRLYFSADGIHWSAEIARSAPCGDRTTFFWNPFRKVWVFSIREGTLEMGRVRKYSEHADIVEGVQRMATEPNWSWWVGADRLDAARTDLKVQPQLYNLDGAGYESLMIGLFSIWRGAPTDRGKPNDVLVGFSRDGFHWTRPSRKAFIPISENYGDWNWVNIQSSGGACVVAGDRLYFYVMGWAGVRGTVRPGVGSTGLATLRRDGFASMDAGDREGALTTRPVRFTGQHLFVNVDSAAGELRVEVLDQAGKVIAPFSRRNCLPVRANRTLEAVRWRKGGDLSSLAGQPVKFRFYLKNARLYAFWVSAGRNGASRGYVAAGGPGFTGPVDTVGEAAYAAAAKLR